MTTTPEDQIPAAPPLPAEVPEAVAPEIPEVPSVTSDRVDPRSAEDGYAKEMALLESLVPDEAEAPSVDADPEDEQPDAEELPAEGEEVVAEEDSDESEPEATETEDATDELSEAQASLQVDGWRLSDLKNLAEADLIRMGKAAAKRQAGVKTKFDEHSAKIGELTQKLEASSGKSEAEPVRESTGQPASANLAALSEHFSKVTGLEQGEAEPLLAELQSTFTEPLKQELEQSHRAVDNLSNMVEEMVFDDVKKSMLGDFPALGTKEGVTALKGKLKSLNPNAYSDLSFRDKVAAMVTDAAGLAFKQAAPVVKPATKKKAPTRNQPSLPGQTPSTHGMSHEAVEMQRLEAIERKYGLMA